VPFTVNNGKLSGINSSQLWQDEIWMKTWYVWIRFLRDTRNHKQ